MRVCLQVTGTSDSSVGEMRSNLDLCDGWVCYFVAEEWGGLVPSEFGIAVSSVVVQRIVFEVQRPSP